MKKFPAQRGETAKMDSVDLKKLSWYDVPEDVKVLLMLAAQNWENTAESEKYMNQALEKTEEHTDVFVAAYRYFFYKNNNRLALQMALKVLNTIKKLEKLPDDWQQLKQILVTRKNESQIRLYLNAYAASGLVMARLGEIEEAKKVTSRVKDIDDQNEFGGATVFEVLTRPPEEDD